MCAYSSLASLDANTEPASTVAGPSSLPARPPSQNALNTQGTRPDAKRKRRPKRKRAPGSETNATEDGGEAAHSDVPEETYSTPWIDTLGQTAYESKAQRLHDEIVAFFEYAAPTPDERHARATVIAQVAQVVRRRLATASVDTFGSVAQDLYLPDGDTDLVITTPHTYDDETKKRVLFQLAALMRNTGVTDRVLVVAHARVPVISFQTAPDLGSLKIDISLNAADGLRAVPILRDYFKRMPALRFLVLTLKSLLSRHGLNSASSSGLSSYGLICLAISFLQLNPAGRPAAYIERPLESESLGVLLMDFLKYYADEFPYETSYVSVAQGKVLPKEEKGWENASRPESLCIECLMNPENDVGRPTSKIRTIRALFRETHSLLEAYPFDAPPGPLNVLGTVLGVSESTLAHRALIKEVVTSGRLTMALHRVQNSGPPAGVPSGRRPPPSSAQQPYPPRQYSRTNGNADSRDGKGLPRRPPPPTAEGGGQVSARPGAHGLPARPPPPEAGYPQRGAGRGGGPTSGGRLLDRISDPQASKRRRG
ncbi:hypothetical protein C8Q77DRAFT_1214485 [Trametes polyzona]|nr:hypothetical protein C8Q77DRAFT_1214485 [Trametes polyzona]